MTDTQNRLSECRDARTVRPYMPLVNNSSYHFANPKVQCSNFKLQSLPILKVKGQYSKGKVKVPTFKCRSFGAATRPRKQAISINKKDYFAFRLFSINFAFIFKKTQNMEQDFLIYNTLTRSKELFKPLHAPNVGMYVCGPTSMATHIWGMRGPQSPLMWCSAT